MVEVSDPGRGPGHPLDTLWISLWATLYTKAPPMAATPWRGFYSTRVGALFSGLHVTALRDHMFPNTRVQNRERSVETQRAVIMHKMWRGTSVTLC